MVGRTRGCDVGVGDESLGLLVGLSSAGLPLQLWRAAARRMGASFSALRPGWLVCHWLGRSVKWSASREQGLFGEFSYASFSRESQTSRCFVSSHLVGS